MAGPSNVEHVRALNYNFASWVQLQWQTRPNDLWYDGIKVYMSEASKIEMPADVAVSTGISEQTLVNALETVAKGARTPFENMTDQEKCFVDASKAFTTIAGAGITGLNVFGVSIAYMSKMKFHADGKAKSDSEKSGTVGIAHRWLLAVTFFCFLYTCCSAAVAHATVHRRQLLTLLKTMIYLELALVCAICGLYYYMLTMDNQLIYWFWVPFLAFLAMSVGVNRLLYDPPRATTTTTTVPSAS